LTALSVNVRLPVKEPSDAGVNVTPTVQFAPAARAAPQVLLDMAKPVLAVILEKLSPVDWRFVTVTVFSALVIPTATLPKLILLEEKLTGALPLPLTVTV
jgi:hypothetical protein